MNGHGQRNKGFWKAVVRSGWAKNPVDSGFCGVLGVLTEALLGPGAAVKLLQAAVTSLGKRPDGGRDPAGSAEMKSSLALLLLVSKPSGPVTGTVPAASREGQGEEGQ